MLVAQDSLTDLAAARVRDAALLRDIWQAAHKAAEPACRLAKARYFKGRTKEVVVERRVRVSVARRIVRREMVNHNAAGVLSGSDDVVDLVRSFGKVTVFAILRDPAKYHKKKGYSLDEEEPRPGVTFVCAYFMHAEPEKNRPEGPWLHSYEHGGRYWALRSRRIPSMASAAAMILETLNDMIVAEIDREIERTKASMRAAQ